MKSSKKSLISLVILSIVFSSLVFFSLPVKADESLLQMQTGMSDIETVYGKKTPQDPRLLAARIINVILGFLGLIVLALIVFSGFQWMTSGGDEKKIGDAKKRLTNAIIGLIIILAAWSLTRYIIIIFNKTIINQAIDYTHY
jgi:hypothetical protein